MSVRKFVEMLLPSIDKAEIVEHAATTLGELSENVIPVYTATLSSGLFVKDFRAKSSWVAKREDQFRRRFRATQTTVIESTARALDKLLPRLEFVAAHLEKDLVNDLHRDGITYPKAIMLNLLDQASFFVSYARKLLLLYYIHEIPNYNKELREQSPFSKAEIKLMDEQYHAFLSLVEIFSRDENSFVNAFKEIPDVMVAMTDEDSFVDRSNYGDAVEPPAVVTGFLPPNWSPIFKLRMKMALLEDTRARSAEAEKQALEMRMVQLRRLLEGGEATAAQEKAIDNLDKRIADLNYKLAKMGRARP